ncbi:MAG: flagellar hook-associated protein FlgK [Deltaproteobacteria bacterium]|nr:MAG: flagellar hook-associated protein FlgK [Deltaproteobacteria bacterium]
MSSLLRMLDLGSAALLAQQSGTAVASRNVANVNTEGYVRESIDLQSELAAPLVGGVRAGDPRRAQTELLAARERDRGGELGSARAYALAMGGLEDALTSANDDLSTRLAELFAAFSRLSAAPMDEAVRGDVVAAASEVARSFRSAAADITAAQDDADARIEQIAARASELAADIAAANRALATSADPVIADRRELAARKLAELVGGAARIDPDGQMRFVVAGGVVVVDGDRAATFDTSPDPGLGGRRKIEVVDGVHRDDVTARLDGGVLAGEVKFRDVTAASALARLDALAADVASNVNAVHSANAGLDGVTGRNLFTAATSAAALDLDPAVAVDPRLVAAAAPGAGPGDSQGALALIDLRDQKLAAGATRSFVDESISLVADIGRDTATARSAMDFAAARLDALAALRDSVAGVSLEEEMTRLSQFARASEAAARVVGTVDDLLATLIDTL